MSVLCSVRGEPRLSFGAGVLAFALEVSIDRLGQRVEFYDA